MAENQMTGSYGQCGEAVHVTDNNNHKCGQAYCNRCSEVVVLYLGYYYVLPNGQFEKLTQKNLKYYQSLSGGDMEEASKHIIQGWD